ncbi:MAG TPA: hypothetical protein VGN16_23060 [Acidobacteriaceae bacterium]
MKHLRSTPEISALLLSLGLVTFIPGILRLISTWRQLYFPAEGYREQNMLMPMGCFALGFVIIGLTVLWTGYRKKQRWAWFVMLVILLCFVFPANVLPLLLDSMQNGGFRLSLWFDVIRKGEWLYIQFALEVLTFVVMMIALLMPIRYFFGKFNEGEVIR